MRATTSVLGDMDFHYREDAGSTSFDEFRKVVESRRSVRLYQDEAIPDSVVKQCIDLSLLAPNSCNLQPWEFHWAKSEEIRNKLAELCFHQPAADTAPVLIACVARTKTWKRSRQQMLDLFSTMEEIPASAVKYYKTFVPLIYSQGPLGILGPIRRLLVGLIGLFRPIPRGPFGKTGLTLWATKSTALACENLMLAFRAAGYDSCAMEGFDARRVEKLLKLPRDASVVMIVAAGKRKQGGIYGRRVRFDSKLFVKEH